jgi:hypothetical protein
MIPAYDHVRLVRCRWLVVVQTDVTRERPLRRGLALIIAAVEFPLAL